jgi:hypothetical protein
MPSLCAAQPASKALEIAILLLVGSFNTPAHPFIRALVKPHRSFFEFGQGNSVVPASKGPSLKRAETVNDDGEQSLLGDAVNPRFFDRAVLEVDVHGLDGMVIQRALDAANLVVMAGTSLAGRVAHRDFQRLIQPVDDMVRDESVGLGMADGLVDVFLKSVGRFH